MTSPGRGDTGDTPNILDGASTAIDPRTRETFWELVVRRAAISCDRTAFVDERDRSITFAGLRDRAERVAAGLFEMGIGPGSRLTWQLPTRIDTVVLSLALARLGAVQNPVIHVYREREVASLVRQTEAEWIVVLGEWRGFDYEALAHRVLEQTGSGARLLVLGDGDSGGAVRSAGGLPEGDPATLPPPPTDGTAVRWIYSTSGTTSEPKGVRHTDQTLLFGGWGSVATYDPVPTDVASVAFPIAHIGGPLLLTIALSRALTTVLLETFVPEAALEVFRRNGVTMSGGSTAFYIAFLNEQRKDPSTPILPTLRMLQGGGAPKPPEVFWQVQRELGVRILHGYGMTECPMMANSDWCDTDEQLANSDGAPVPGCEIRIRSSGRADAVTLPAGEVGEIQVRGPMLSKGYLDAALTAEAFLADGWFRTGDLGYLRPDGHIVITGRTKDMIIRKGENIAAREVEDVLQEHPKVGAVAVIGLPDPERGERVCAVVETRPGADPLSFLEMQAHCREAGLMTQKIPEQLEIVEALPRNATLKIRKDELRTRYA
jgi:cyclohexanecarboxylate-CoA ligase